MAMPASGHLTGGEKEAELTANSLRELLTEVENRYPVLAREILTQDSREICEEYVLLLNGKTVSSLDTEIRDGDKVTILPVVMGG